MKSRTRVLCISLLLISSSALPMGGFASKIGPFLMRNSKSVSRVLAFDIPFGYHLYNFGKKKKRESDEKCITALLEGAMVYALSERFRQVFFGSLSPVCRLAYGAVTCANSIGWIHLIKKAGVEND